MADATTSAPEVPPRDPCCGAGSDSAPEEGLRETVRLRYAAAARRVADGSGPAEEAEVFGVSCYAGDELVSLPTAATEASLGCGDPTALADLHEGETVLDLGSGGGIDVLLAARRVGPDGFVFGLDMTEEMLELARRNQAEAGVTNAAFLQGLIEEIPLEDAVVDVIISNCVINLSADKTRVFAEMFRVLRPGGRIAVSDVVADDALTPEERRERGSWVGCIAGALSFAEYERGLREVGFTAIALRPTHAVAEGMFSTAVRAVRPA